MREKTQTRLLPELATRSAAQFSELRAAFEATGDGRDCLRRRSELVDAIVRELYLAWIASLPADPEGVCLIAVGGYGRADLFPYSDLDLLFVARDSRILSSCRDAIAGLARDLWDLQMRVSHSARTLEECARFDSENLEFSISLLDLRYLAGERALFEALQNQTLPHLIGRDGPDLVRNLVSKSSERHSKHGHTIFHLEPDVKEAPGGLRDYHVARWLARIREISSSGRGASAAGPTAEPAQRVEQAVQFLSSVRCFLHFDRKRNDNLLTYELQDEAAARAIGGAEGLGGKPGNSRKSTDAAQWMRAYYRHVRSVESFAGRAIEDSRPPRSSLYGLFQDWRSRLSTADFSVIQGKIFPRSPAPAGWPALLSLFEMMARHSLDLSREAERWVEESRAGLVASATPAPDSPPAPPRATPARPPQWPAFRRMLALPATANALRAMHRLGLLDELIPEFRSIDALVIRDFYHRYTVDEHTFMTIETLCELKRGSREAESGTEENLGAWKAKLSDLYAAIEQPELLTLALLLHDVGKGMEAPDHAAGSVEAARTASMRLGLDAQDQETLCFLIASHLEMSATVSRRDIFDPETLRSFAAKVGTSERLKMLCLMTCSDIQGVNPEALTPWKAEMIWQLYLMSANYLLRSVDEDRLQTAQPSLSGELRAPGGDDRSELKLFLEGFPRRYLAAHSPSEIAEHVQWARKVSQNTVYVKVRRRGAFSELAVLALDRPLLFASVTGTLAAWGMNIIKAEAFANRSGLVLDIFRFHDLYRTLELNPSETERLEQAISDVLAGSVSVAALLQGRSWPPAVKAKVRIATRVSFDDSASSRCTILELLAQDRPGLLYTASTILARFGCSIEVAMIETEAQKAVDVFYLTRSGAKLSPDVQQEIYSALIQQLS
ncbi:MAG: [protein-PII] uridylyltransferase [Terriglobia bacterium]